VACAKRNIDLASIETRAFWLWPLPAPVQAMKHHNHDGAKQWNQPDQQQLKCLLA
jgi:hypothetical protein